jgi:hypothetical protein
MTLSYENGASTSASDWSVDVPEGTTAPWVAPMREREGKTRDSSLAALAGTAISSRFCSWIGLSGRRYIFSVYQAADCPAFRDAILLTAVRDMMGQRRVVSVYETGAFPEPVIAKAQHELSAFAPGVEFHLHLLTRSPAERRVTVADLAIAEA